MTGIFRTVNRVKWCEINNPVKILGEKAKKKIVFGQLMVNKYQMSIDQLGSQHIDWYMYTL